MRMVVVLHFRLHSEVHVLLMGEVIRRPGDLIEAAFLSFSGGVTAGALLRGRRDTRVPFF